MRQILPRLIFACLLWGFGVASASEVLWPLDTLAYKVLGVEPFTAALESRDSAYIRAGIDRSNVAYGNWDDLGREVVLRGSGSLERDATPWAHLLRSLALRRSDSLLALGSARSALGTATGKPGQTWVLAVEWLQAGQWEWAEMALGQLRQQMVQSGAWSLPLVSSHLVALSHYDKVRSQKWMQWASDFNPDDARFLLWKVANNRWGEAFVDLRASWVLQVTVARHAFGWLRIVILVMLVVVILTLSIRIFIHLPMALGQRIMVLLIALLTMIPGFLLFLFSVGAASFRFLPTDQRRIMLLALLALGFAPLDSVVRAAFAPDKVNRDVALYLVAHRSLPHTKLLSQIESAAKLTPSPLLFSAQGLQAAKLGLIDKAYTSFTEAIRLSPKDPVALAQLGALMQQNRRWSDAKGLYKKALALGRYDHPDILYNLSRCYLAEKGQIEVRADRVSSQDSTGLRGRRLGGSLSQVGIGATGRTDMLWPDYSTRSFWGGMFWKSIRGSAQSAQLYWGKSLVGIPPLLSYLFFLAICLGLWQAGHTAWASMPVWTKQKDVQARPNEQRLRRDQHRENLRRQMDAYVGHRIRCHVLNLLFPGLGDIIREESLSLVGVIMLLLSSLVFSIYGGLLIEAGDMGFDGGRQLAFRLLLLPVGYQLLHIAINLWRIRGEWRLRGGIRGI